MSHLLIAISNHFKDYAISKISSLLILHQRASLLSESPVENQHCWEIACLISSHTSRRFFLIQRFTYLAMEELLQISIMLINLPNAELRTSCLAFRYMPTTLLTTILLHGLRALLMRHCLDYTILNGCLQILN